jgi:intracellular sulfur oxidation DsrE/DsrF family protein
MKQLLIGMLAAMLLPCALAMELNEDKPFAQHHLVLQLSEATSLKQAGVVNIANNLIRHYEGPDNIDIQIVTFAGGVQLLRRDDNPQEERLKSLMLNGVKFVICLNTLDTMEQKTGRRMAY